MSKRAIIESEHDALVDLGLSEAKDGREILPRAAEALAAEVKRLVKEIERLQVAPRGTTGDESNYDKWAHYHWAGCSEGLSTCHICRGLLEIKLHRAFLSDGLRQFSDWKAQQAADAGGGET